MNDDKRPRFASKRTQDRDDRKPQQSDKLVIYGKNPVLEAVKLGLARAVYIRKGTALYDVDFNVPVTIMHKNEFDGRFHADAQGVAADIDSIIPRSFESVAEELKTARGVLILDRIQDPHNFGALIRSAHVFGIKHIIFPRYEQAPLSPVVIKASAGAALYTTFIEETNLRNVLVRLKDLGFQRVAADMDGEALSSVKFALPVALVVGSEGHGLRDSIREESDMVVSIPMQGQIDSLNAAQSAAILLYGIFGVK
jgi:23S rRNA (guanosine2251-2'-O)-methyltransferase